MEKLLNQAYEVRKELVKKLKNLTDSDEDFADFVYYTLALHELDKLIKKAKTEYD